MAAYRYPLPRGYRRVKYPYRFRKDSSGVLPVMIAGAVLLAGAGAGAKAATAPHKAARHAASAPKASASPQPEAAPGPGEAGFVAAVLADLGAPDSSANQQSMAGWAAHEGCWGCVGENNQWDSTLPMPGSTAFNYLPGGGSVQNYPNASEGAQATALTLEDGYYPAIVAALRSGQGVCGGGFASELLTWSGSGYSEVC